MRSKLELTAYDQNFCKVNESLCQIECKSSFQTIGIESLPTKLIVVYEAEFYNVLLRYCNIFRYLLYLQLIVSVAENSSKFKAGLALKLIRQKPVWLAQQLTSPIETSVDDAELREQWLAFVRPAQQCCLFIEQGILIDRQMALLQ